jgi:hypothetical protein
MSVSANATHPSCTYEQLHREKPQCGHKMVTLMFTRPVATCFSRVLAWARKMLITYRESRTHCAHNKNKLVDMAISSFTVACVSAAEHKGEMSGRRISCVTHTNDHSSWQFRP